MREADMRGSETAPRKSGDLTMWQIIGYSAAMTAIVFAFAVGLNVAAKFL